MKIVLATTAVAADLYRGSSRRSTHLITSEKDWFSFLARFAALFSIKVFSGFFFSCFLLSLPLLMIATPLVNAVSAYADLIPDIPHAALAQGLLLSNIGQSRK
jgi:hypothetical protein